MKPPPNAPPPKLLTGGLQLRLTYHPTTSSVRVEADLGPDPVGIEVCRRPELNPEYMVILREELLLA